jgi:hypothetical protein
MHVLELLAPGVVAAAVDLADERGVIPQSIHAHRRLAVAKVQPDVPPGCRQSTLRHHLSPNASRAAPSSLTVTRRFWNARDRKAVAAASEWALRAEAMSAVAHSTHGKRPRSPTTISAALRRIRTWSVLRTPLAAGTTTWTICGFIHSGRRPYQAHASSPSTTAPAPAYNTAATTSCRLLRLPGVVSTTPGRRRIHLPLLTRRCTKPRSSPCSASCAAETTPSCASISERGVGDRGSVRGMPPTCTPARRSRPPQMHLWKQSRGGSPRSEQRRDWLGEGGGGELEPAQ